MSILKHRDEFLALYKYAKNENFKPSKPFKETDILGFTYTNKPEVKKNESSNNI